MNEWTKKRKTMREYDLTAHLYDMRYAEEQIAKIEVALKNVRMDKQDLVLDDGCGTGLLFACITDKAKTIVGTDMSKKTLLKAKWRIGNFANAHLILADADFLPFKKEIFSHVFAVTLIQNTPHPVETLNEIKRVAEKHATIVVTALKSIFTLGTFRALLANVGLKIVALHSEGLQCHVAVCTFSLR